jgi:hypothetical protein
MQAAIEDDFAVVPEAVERLRSVLTHVSTLVDTVQNPHAQSRLRTDILAVIHFVADACADAETDLARIAEAVCGAEGATA